MNKIKFSNCSCEILPGNFDINKIPLNCDATWRLISSGFTTGIFQLETHLGMEWAKKVQPNSIEELAALISILRPGPLESGQADEYVDIKFGKKQPSYLHPLLKSILEPTYSSLIYQEQSLKIAADLAGFSLEESDTLRKGLGKKDTKIIAELKNKFINGCIKNKKISKETAEQIFGWIQKGQRYLFNRSHAVAYAMLGYQTGYMKTHFPREFFTSQLTYSQYKADSKDEIYKLVQDARLFGIDIYPPDIRHRNTHFEIVNNPNEGIRFGLAHIRNVGQSAIEKITDSQDLSSWNKFLKAVPALHRNVGIALIQSGACDYYNISRSQMIYELEIILGKTLIHENGKKKNGNGLTEKERDWFFTNLKDNKTVKDTLELMLIACENASPRLSIVKKDDLINIARKFLAANKWDDNIFSKNTKPEIIDLLLKHGYKENIEKKPCSNKNRIEELKKKIEQLNSTKEDTNTGKAIAEKYFLGISLSCSPADDADSSQASHTCLDVAKALNGQNISVCAIIDNVKFTKTKKGKKPGSKMCFVTISDSTYSISYAVIFPDAFEELKQFCYQDYICMFYGTKKNGSFIISNIKKLI